MEKAVYFLIYIFLLFNSFKVSFSLIVPIKKIIFTTNIRDLYSKLNIQWNLESKGYGIFFNEKSDISLIPYNLYLDISNYFLADENIKIFVKPHKNGTEELIFNANFEDENPETMHFILENFGISIPFKYFYIEKKHQEYSLRFLTKKDQEYIEFGKDLIDFIKIEFKDEKNFVIHNEEFLTKIDE